MRPAEIPGIAACAARTRTYEAVDDRPFGLTAASDRATRGVLLMAEQIARGPIGPSFSGS